MAKYYVEFVGSAPCEEIGTMIDALDPDEAIGVAKASIMIELSSLDGQTKLGTTPFEFAGWNVDKVMRRDD